MRRGMQLLLSLGFSGSFVLMFIKHGFLQVACMKCAACHRKL